MWLSCDGRRHYRVGVASMKWLDTTYLSLVTGAARGQGKPSRMPFCKHGREGLGMVLKNIVELGSAAVRVDFLCDSL